MSTFFFILALAQAAAFLVTGVCCTVSTILASAPSAEEQERACMRSISWPTEDGKHFDA
jgi:hypothetical protein